MSGSSKPQPQSRPGLEESQIRGQLEKILSSATFIRSERMSGFLRYIVEQTLNGNGHTLKEPVIAQDCFDQGRDFDGAANPIVRVEARRLRDKLREYYEGAEGDPVLIRLPKGSYVPSFERNGATMPAVVLPLPRPEVVVPAPHRQSRTRVVQLAVVLTVLVAAGVAVWYLLKPYPPRVVRMRHLAHEPGNEFSPSLSPDGNFVVFAWSNDGPADLFVKAVDSESVRRLTETPDHEMSPAWSPDGREITFIRAGKGAFIISVLGGAEHKIADLKRVLPGSSIGWSADSKSVFLNDSCPGPDVDKFCVYRIALDTLEKRQISNDSHGGDTAFAASPDGRTLAVVRSTGRASVSDVFLLPIAGGEARRLTMQNRAVDHVAWAPDGKSVIYSVLEGARFRLWRTTASAGSGNGEPLSPLGQYADMPSIARNPATGLLRVAYRSRIHDVGLRLVTLNPAAAVGAAGTAVPFADTTEGRDCSARFSPDASQVAFYSIRTGDARMWVANRDGSGLRPLTRMVAQEIKPGGWSPDGSRIAFDADIDGNSDIYITDSTGAEPLRITSEPSIEAGPSWSVDGHWIYFSSDRSGSYEIWKVPATGGPATRLTFHGGFKPQPSPDGGYVYYVRSPGSRQPLKRVPAAGGEESAVMDSVPHHNVWTVTSKGIYFLAQEPGGPYLDLYDPATARRGRVGTLSFRVAPPFFCGFLNVSQDGGYLIANHADRDETNLGLIELQ